jgi:hypothetical protein
MLDLAYGNATVQALTVASLAPLRELQDKVGGAPFLTPRGVMYVARFSPACSVSSEPAVVALSSALRSKRWNTGAAAGSCAARALR